MKNIEKKSILQFVKFGLVGVCNTIVYYIMYSICYYIFHMNYHSANAAGFIISIFTAFLLQNQFVFKENPNREHRIWWKVLIKTYISYIFSGLILTELLLTLWLQVIHIEHFMLPIADWFLKFEINISTQNLAVSVAPLLNMIFTIPINFCINKFWAYRQGEL